MGAEESMIATLSLRHAAKDPSGTLETFRSYNILLYATQTPSLTWSLQDLSQVGNIDQLRDVQDHQRRGSEDTMDDIHVQASLRDLYQEGLEENGRVLNALSLPCSTPTTHPLQPHIRAFQQTSNLPDDIFKAQYPITATSFWLVATKGAISYLHPDCHGVGTVVEVLCGRKLWYVFQRRYPKARGTRHDSRIDEYMRDWAPGFIPDADQWEAEVVVLEPGSAFYMRPDTHHAVVTFENSIARAHRVYATVTLSRTVAGYVHTCMLKFRIVNVLHRELRELLLRLMCYFCMVILKGPESK
ncbi:hypothetical protein EV421DRAFT_89832 [Armillaria borealis]|uniref:JmjC domain-containing protein n=1 Tax=Armillaria borealis TaxID=47425 RepID=A0AA39N4B8_9AGAR|nr:hypothetical protein EV421DRAFT_89832 [Armillaria borealis]